MEFKHELTLQNILLFVSKEDIYRRYLPTEFEFNFVFSSPFREDKKPSFIIGNHKRNYKWKDFATGESDDCIGFVMKLFKITFNDALTRIAIDLGLINKFLFYSNLPQPSTLIAKYENVMMYEYNYENDRTIEIEYRDWEQHDIDYWESMGISQETATKGWIFPVRHYFVNGRYVACMKHCYVYVEMKDGIYSYKFYQPFSIYKKWTSYNDLSVVELWHTLPETGDFLVITSSRKDALSVQENLELPSISFQAESVHPKKQVMDELKRRFRYIFLFYDNDFKGKENWGQIQAEKLRAEHNYLINIKTPDSSQRKDYSDLNEGVGRLQAKTIMKEVMREAYLNFDIFS